MAAYCEAADLSKWGVNAAALDGIGTSEKTAAIGGASDTIDSYLRSRFDLPLTAYGDDVKRACAIIAVYDLIAARGYDPGEPGDDNLRLRYEDILAWLKRVADGTVTPNATGSASGDTAGKPSFRAQVVSNTQRGWSISDGSGGPFSGGR
jgi:phage gp36-like protein